MTLNTKSDGILAVWLKPPIEIDEEFNEWYNTEHLQQITSQSGFINGHRYKSIGTDTWYLALYDLETLDAFFDKNFQNILANPTPWSRRIKRKFNESENSDGIRNVYRKTLSLGDEPQKLIRFILMTKMDIAREGEDEFNDWYNNKHALSLVQVPGCLRIRRFEAEAIVGETPKFLAIFDLSSYEVLKSEAWIKAQAFGQTEKMRSYITNFNKDCYQFIFGIDANGFSNDQIQPLVLASVTTPVN
ncbi:hypothetical protein [Nostoc sp. C117]|uniref:hypothetical protein n=1 Tax=Nostoc sp. C117 TaxID=3349875 RepID=UPI00370D215B